MTTIFGVCYRMFFHNLGSWSLQFSMNEIFHTCVSHLWFQSATTSLFIFRRADLTAFVFLFFSAPGHCEPPADSSVFQHFVKHFVLWLQREEKTQFLRPGWQLSNILQVNTAAILGTETAYMNSQAQFDTKSVSLLVLPYTTHCLWLCIDQ